MLASFRGWKHSCQDKIVWWLEASRTRVWLAGRGSKPPRWLLQQVSKRCYYKITAWITYKQQTHTAYSSVGEKLKVTFSIVAGCFPVHRQPPSPHMMEGIRGFYSVFFLFFSLFLPSLFYVYDCFACMYVCALWACLVPMELQVVGNPPCGGWNETQSLRASARAPSTPNY